MSYAMYIHEVSYVFRAELSSEDDLSPDSDSDTMDVDSTTQEAASVAVSRGDKRQQQQQTGPSANGKASAIAGALVPDTTPQFAVSQYDIIITFSCGEFSS